MAFICDQCGKSFNDKSNFNRHMKTHSGGQTYSCSVCQAVFSRADNRKRHEESHQYQITCDICGQFFNRDDALRRHRALHDRPAPKPATKRSASPEPVPSGLQPKQPRIQPPSQSTTPPPPPRSPDVDLPEDPETRALYLHHWASIRNTENTGNTVQDRYNFTLDNIAATNFPEMVRRIFRNQTTAFRINLSFGFILRHVESGELRYYHPSQNNARFLEVPHLIRTEEDLNQFLDELSRQDMLEYIRQQREDTKWVVHLVTNVTFYINKIAQHPIGAKVNLPDFILKNRGIVAVVGGSSGPYNDNLCFFRCLAVHKGAPIVNVETPAKMYYHQYLQHKPSQNFQGVYLDDLTELEQLFEINIFVYDLQETEDEEIAARLVRRSPFNYPDTMNLNLYEQHFSYVSDMKKYSHSYLCSKCDRLWKHIGMLHRHERTCTGDVVYKFPGGVYRPPQNIFEQLTDENIYVPIEDRYYPYRATYDIEVMLQPTDKIPSNKLEWTNHHVLLSISVCSNVPDYTEPVCFVSDGDTNQVVHTCLEYLREISLAAYDILSDKFEPVFERIQKRLNEMKPSTEADDPEEGEEKKNYLCKMMGRLDHHLQELPVIGFNSGKYDLNAMKVDFFVELLKREKINITVKKNNNFMCVSTENLKFLDITNYLAPGFSYSQFLKAYDCTEEKGHFPYEWMTSLDKLDSTQLPSHTDFFSHLKNTNISTDDYNQCQRVWKDNNMSTMKDFLEWYNNKDVVPMLEAIEKMFQYYKNQNVDAFKDGISVPGLTLKYMFQDLPTYFTTPNEKNKDLYHLFKNNIVGGPSIVFHRYHEKGVTFIRPTDYADPKPCNKIIGFDANALYLWCIMQAMPTGHFVRRRSEDHFRRDTPKRYERMAIEWLEWESRQIDQQIIHHGNHKEKLIGVKRLPVDGYLQTTDTVYEFQGCYWHGHHCRLNKNPESEESQQRYKKTQDKIKYITEQGHNVQQIWECEWEELKKTNPALQQFVKGMGRPCDNNFKMSEEAILKAVMENRMFGALEVDIEVPDRLKSKFAEMPPIFKNVEISRDDIGEHMKIYAEERDIMTQPRKSLIGSMFGEKILIITPLLKWYIKHGLKVSKIHQVVEYTPASCFKEFGEEISQARREGDKDPDKKIFAETKKLEGNSSYGKTGTNKEKHRDVFYCNGRTVSRYLVDPSFRRCNQLDDNTFEIEMNKKSITLDLPNQIAYFVYQYAKLRMLEFYFDFMDVFVDRRDFQYCSMDTDSAYMALSAETLDEVIRPELRHRYLKEKHQWFPRDDTSEHAAYDKRTPGLFKEEYSGDGIIALCSKTYYCFGKEDKFSCKGINKNTNDINKNTYMDVLLTKKSGSGTNRGFRSVNNQMFTYFQERAGFSYFYPKRKVLSDGISTAPLSL